MKTNQRLLICASLLAAVFILKPAIAGAGGHFGLHFGTGGFGVSVGAGDWGVHTTAWSNPQWSPSFNVALEGYGEWVWIEGLGRCWRPWVAAGWRPYTHGRWARTGLSLTWVAYEPWGYFPHHYGNWAHASYGWVWVPGYTYVSANVTWVRGGAHVGWYARPPHGWSHSARAFHHGYRHGYRDGWNDARYGTYVGWQHFTSGNVSHHAVAHTVASKTHLNHGGAVPNNDELWRKGRSKLSPSRVSTRTVRMDGREVTLARPDGSTASIERHAPGTVRTALSEPAQRLRQPQVVARQSTEGHSTRSAAVGSASRRSRVTESRVRSPNSAGQRKQSNGALSRSELRGLPSHSRFQSTTAGVKRADAGRSGNVPRVSPVARKTGRTRAAAPSRTRITTASLSRQKRSQSGTSSGKPTTAQNRRPPTRPQSKKIETERSTADSSKKKTKRRPTPGRRR